MYNAFGTFGAYGLNAGPSAQEQVQAEIDAVRARLKHPQDHRWHSGSTDRMYLGFAIDPTNLCYLLLWRGEQNKPVRALSPTSGTEGASQAYTVTTDQYLACA